MPTAINPAEFQMDLVNTDLAQEGDETFRRMNRITTAWTESEANQGLCEEIDENSRSSQKEGDLADLSWMKDRKPNTLIMSIVLLQRAWIKAHRDIVAYGIRVVMYLGLAILMGTVFLRFSTSQKYIQPFINAIFFGSAFMSFMAVAYVPAFLEDRATFAKERADGLVGPFAFLLSNFIIGLPFLFLIAFLFAIIAYFLSNFRSDGTAFFMFTMWLFLDLLAAESLVVLVSVLIPIFVVALAIAAFANGLWMCVGGFLVPMSILNPFWKYVFHYIDYQAYVFQGMMVNEFKSRRYDCDRLGDGFQCMYPSEPNAPGKVAGSAVLSALKIPQDQEKEWVGIMIAIIAVYRILAYIVLRLKER